MTVREDEGYIEGLKNRRFDLLTRIDNMQFDVREIESELDDLTGNIEGNISDEQENE